MVKRAFAPGVLVIALLVGFTGCGLLQSTAIIDWVNFVRFGGITYLASFNAGRELQPADLGPQFAAVRSRLEGNVHDASYQTQDGDAAFLDAGTPVYQVRGYAPTFRLAAHQDGKLTLFEADTNPHAKIGADLLDIGGKVQSIAVTDDTTSGSPLATITDAHQLTTLVTLLLAAPVDQSRPSADSGPRYWLTFNLTDGTQVGRVYLPDAHEVARGIIVPDAFVATLAATLPA
jgi:hypothetical protein